MDAGPAFVAKSIEVQLGVRPERVAKVASGYGEEVYEAVVGDRTVVFKADREVRRGRVVLEAWAYQRVRELGAPVPRVLATDLGRDTYPRNFIVIEKLAGTPLAETQLEPEEHKRMIREAGWAIRTVHEIGIPGFGPLDESTYLRNAQVQGAYDTWGESIDEALGASLPALREAGALDDADVEWIDGVVSGLADYYELGPVGHLLHGSFDPEHVLVDQGRLSGIVDFGNRRSGDPAWDLGGFLVKNAAETRHLLAGYDADKDRAALLEVTIPLYGGIRALTGAGRAHEENRLQERDELLDFARASFRVLAD